MMKDIANNISALYKQITVDAAKYHRNREDITLIAVSKTRTPEEILAAAAGGQRDFGENYLQEALDKINILAEQKLTWHFIGNIQSNKTAPIAENFDWVHTIDRKKIAQRLNDQRPAHLPSLNVCIEVNLSQENTKSGISLAEIPTLAKSINQMPKLRLRGLMALPAPATDFEIQRKPFRQLADALKKLQNEGFAVDTLSMGTTADYKAAIAEGTTMVRLGTAVFGPRTQ